MRLTNGAEFKNPAYAPIYINYIPWRDRDRKDPKKLLKDLEMDGTKVERETDAKMAQLGLESKQPLLRFRPNDESLKQLDPEQIAEQEKQRIREKRGSYEFPVEVDRDPTLPPQNPRGRTGFCGLGELRLWGPNQSVDMIITRHDTATSEWQVLTIYDAELKRFKLPGKRLQDAKLQKLPTSSIMHNAFKEGCLKTWRQANKIRASWNARGGSKDESATERRQRAREAGEARIAAGLSSDSVDEEATDKNLESTQRDMQYAREDEAKQMRLKYLLEDLFASRSTDLYRGYVDDERNTDNAWIETVCHGFHCPEELAAVLDFVRHDDVHPLEVELQVRLLETARDCSRMFETA